MPSADLEAMLSGDGNLRRSYGHRWGLKPLLPIVAAVAVPPGPPESTVPVPTPQRGVLPGFGHSFHDNGAAVIQWGWTGGDNQRFAVEVIDQMQRSLVAAITALLLGIVGVAALAVDPAASVRPSPQIRLAAGELIRISPLGTCSVTGDFEGCSSPNEMPAYLQCIVPVVDGWIDQVYQSMPHPNEYNFVPRGVTGVAAGAQGCPYDEGSLMYCFADRGVYLGAAAVWQQYSQFGDAAPPTILAHEVTHHFPNMRGMLPGAIQSGSKIRRTAAQARLWPIRGTWG